MARSGIDKKRLFNDFVEDEDEKEFANIKEKILLKVRDKNTKKEKKKEWLNMLKGGTAAYQNASN